MTTISYRCKCWRPKPGALSNPLYFRTPVSLQIAQCKSCGKFVIDTKSVAWKAFCLTDPVNVLTFELWARVEVVAAVELIHSRRVKQMFKALFLLSTAALLIVAYAAWRA